MVAAGGSKGILPHQLEPIQDRWHGGIIDEVVMYKNEMRDWIASISAGGEGKIFIFHFWSSLTSLDSQRTLANSKDHNGLLCVHVGFSHLYARVYLTSLNL